MTPHILFHVAYYANIMILPDKSTKTEDKRVGELIHRVLLYTAEIATGETLLIVVMGELDSWSRIKMLFPTLPPCIRVSGLSPDSTYNSSFLLLHIWKAANDASRSWVPATHVGDQDCVLWSLNLA